MAFSRVVLVVEEGVVATELALVPDTLRTTNYTGPQVRYAIGVHTPRDSDQVPGAGV